MQHYTVPNDTYYLNMFQSELFHVTFTGNNVSNFDFLNDPATETVFNRMTGY